MYFPDNMTFQYFFFDTYIGYFLQALPIALLAGIIYSLVRRKKDKALSIYQKATSCVFVCYIVGLTCIVWGLDIMSNAWYWLLYHMDPGHPIRWFSGEFDFIPDFFRHLSAEVIGNCLIFMPFGILFPLSQTKPAVIRTVLFGFVCILAIEMLQPVVGRSFDINDIILNTLSVIISTAAFFIISFVLKKCHKKE